MAATSTATAAAAAKQIHTDLSPILKVYTDGTVDRLFSFPDVPPLPSGDPTTGVSSKDILNPPARLYLPELTNPTQKLPILLYFHGGGFCLGSPYSSVDRRYMEILSSSAQTLIISVKYRIAPENPLPAAYADAWTALKWLCSHVSDHQTGHQDLDPWITNHGDFDKIFIGGDSAGANIAHNLAMQAGSDPLPGHVKIHGIILSHPYFWGSIPPESNKITKEDNEKHILYRMWMLAYPNARNGIDNPMINPVVDGAPSLSGLGGSKMLVCLSEKDVLREWGIAYIEGVKKSGWKGEIEVFEVKDEDHCFHLFDPQCDKAMDLIKSMSLFIMK